MHTHVMWPNKIGRVTVRIAGESVSAHENLKAAVKEIGVYRLLLSDSGISVASGGEWLPAVNLNFYDSRGNFIPPEAVMACVEETINERALRRVVFRHCRLVEGRDFAFREGPVPYTGKRSGGNYFRSMRTTQERRDSAGMAADKEMRDHGVRPRGRRSMASLTNAWDDIPRHHDHRNWKRHRKTRWKT